MSFDSGTSFNASFITKKLRKMFLLNLPKYKEKMDDIKYQCLI